LYVKATFVALISYPVNSFLRQLTVLFILLHLSSSFPSLEFQGSSLGLYSLLQPLFNFQDSKSNASHLTPRIASDSFILFCFPRFVKKRVLLYHTLFGLSIPFLKFLFEFFLSVSTPSRVSFISIPLSTRFVKHFFSICRNS